MLHLPPPVHGSTMVGELIKESDLLRDAFHGRYINLTLSEKVNESGEISLKKLVRYAIVWFHLFGKLLHRKPDLCYYALTTTGSGFYKDVLLIVMLRLFGVKIVYHIHNRGIIDAGKNRINNLLYRFVFKHSRVILLSSHLYYDLKKYVPSEMVEICPNGIRDYYPKTTSLIPSGNKPFTILFLSNLMKEKGVFVLVDACSILNEIGYAFQCEFVGGEGDISEPELERYIYDRKLSDKVKYLGKRYGELKEMSFEQADVFVLPSRCDCFPLVVLEAMQHGLPVITAHEGGMPDMVDNGVTGFMISPYDNADALAKKLEFFILNPASKLEMGANGRVRYEQLFTLSIFERRMYNILSKSFTINKES